MCFEAVPADRPLGPAPDGPRPPRQLLGRGEELGGPAGEVRLPVLRRRPPRAHDRLRGYLRDPRGVGRGRDGLAVRGPRPGEERHLRPVACPADGRARARLRDDHAARLARARADVQGADRAAPRAGPRDVRVPRLPGPHDGRHRALPRALRPRRKGPGEPPRDLPRDRPPLQRLLRGRLPRAEGALHGDAEGPGPRRPEDVQELRQHARAVGLGRGRREKGHGDGDGPGPRPPVGPGRSGRLQPVPVSRAVFAARTSRRSSRRSAARPRAAAWTARSTSSAT